MVPLIVALLLALPLTGQGCPHEGSDHRLLGHLGCPVQRKLTIEGARPPRTIWHFHLLKVAVKIDPKHPHLLDRMARAIPKTVAVPDGLPLGRQRESLYFPVPRAKEGGRADARVPNGLATASKTNLKKYI